MSDTVSPILIDTDLAFEREPNKLAYAYWLSRCAENALPSRADLDPVAMKKFTPHVGLVEVRRGADDRRYLIRRAGARWEDVYGAMTGKFLQDFLPAHLAKAWKDIFDTVARDAKPIRLTTQVDFEDKSWLEIELLVAPLAEHNDVNMLFVSFVSWNKTTPR